VLVPNAREGRPYAVSKLFERFPNLTLDSEILPEWLGNAMVRRGTRRFAGETAD